MSINLMTLKVMGYWGGRKRTRDVKEGREWGGGDEWWEAGSLACDLFLFYSALAKDLSISLEKIIFSPLFFFSFLLFSHFILTYPTGHWCALCISLVPPSHWLAYTTLYYADGKSLLLLFHPRSLHSPPPPPPTLPPTRPTSHPLHPPKHIWQQQPLLWHIGPLSSRLDPFAPDPVAMDTASSVSIHQLRLIYIHYILSIYGFSSTTKYTPRVHAAQWLRLDLLLFSPPFFPFFSFFLPCLPRVSSLHLISTEKKKKKKREKC